jgi:PAS domain S-box-containing protein
MAIWVIWEPVYRLDGLVKLLTAVASVPTAILLIRLAPAVIALPSPEQLRAANARLEKEVAERKAAEDEVRRLNHELEDRVEERTVQLAETNRRLAESEQRLQAILDAAPALVYVKDTEGRFTFVNRRFEQLLHREKAEIVGRGDYDLFPESDAGTYRRHDSEVMTEKRPIEFEEIASDSDARRVYMSIKFPLLTSEGFPYALCGISTDITERKHVEQALRDSNEQLERFAFIASHDLQEPLRTVRTYAELFSRRYRGKLDADADESLGFIRWGVDRMQLLIRGIQSYSELNNGGPKQLERISLNEPLENALRLTDTVRRESGVKIKYETLPAVRGNSTQLTQVFQNLITNAIKYRSDQPLQIDISAEERDGEWLLTVRDTGIGLDMKYADQIFGMFKRLHGPHVPGAGVGLAICKRIIEAHGGRIWVESRPGAGAAFRFSLPKSRPNDSLE